MIPPVKVNCMWCGHETYNLMGVCGRCMKERGITMKPWLYTLVSSDVTGVEATGPDCWSCGQPGTRDKARDWHYWCSPCDAGWTSKTQDRGRAKGVATMSVKGEWVTQPFLDHGKGHYPSPA